MSYKPSRKQMLKNAARGGKGISPKQERLKVNKGSGTLQSKQTSRIQQRPRRGGGRGSQRTTTHTIAGNSKHQIVKEVHRINRQLGNTISEHALEQKINPYLEAVYNDWLDTGGSGGNSVYGLFRCTSCGGKSGLCAGSVCLGCGGGSVTAGELGITLVLVELLETGKLE